MNVLIRFTATTEIVDLGVIAVNEILYVESYPPADGTKFLTARRRLGGGNTSCELASASTRRYVTNPVWPPGLNGKTPMIANCDLNTRP